MCTKEYTVLADEMRDAERVESAHRRSGSVHRASNQTRTSGPSTNPDAGPTPMEIGSIQARNFELQKFTKEEREKCIEKVFVCVAERKDTWRYNAQKRKGTDRTDSISSRISRYSFFLLCISGLFNKKENIHSISGIPSGTTLRATTSHTFKRNHKGLLVITGFLHYLSARMLIDPGTEINYIDKSFCQEHGFASVKLRNEQKWPMEMNNHYQSSNSDLFEAEGIFGEFLFRGRCTQNI